MTNIRRDPVGGGALTGAKLRHHLLTSGRIRGWRVSHKHGERRLWIAYPMRWRARP